MRTLVEVKQCDIKYGKQGDACDCAIAKGIKRLLKIDWKDSVYVSLGYPYSEIRVNNIEVCNTKTTKRFIEKFDRSKKNTKPIRFLMNIPSEYLKAA